jgi:hypothetical protein
MKIPAFSAPLRLASGNLLTGLAIKNLWKIKTCEFNAIQNDVRKISDEQHICFSLQFLLTICR